MFVIYILYLVGGFNPLKNISQWEGVSHILWKIKNVPNHQPDIYIYIYIVGGSQYYVLYMVILFCLGNR